MTLCGKGKRILSLLLLLCMLMSLMPAAASAENDEQPAEAVVTEASALLDTAEAEKAALPTEAESVTDSVGFEVESTEEPAAASAGVAEETPAETVAEAAVESVQQPAEAAADSVQMSEEPEALRDADTTWTLELVYTPGTLTQNGASFSDLTLSYSPADPRNGRDVEACWVGMKVNAPEAVTLLNIAMTSYSLDGGETWKSFYSAKEGKNDDGTYYMQAWVPLTVESVKAAVGSRQLLTWTFLFAWDGDKDTAQSFVITVSPENLKLLKDEKTEIEVIAWEIKALNESFAVSFNSAGGSNVKAQTVRFGETAAKPDDPWREHYLFQGWYTAEGALYDFSTPVKGELTLTAHWLGVEHEIVYDDGLGNVLMRYQARYGDPTPAYDGAAPVREGYRFADREGEQSWLPAPAETVLGDASYSAQWVQLATLHFDVNGGDSTVRTDIAADLGSDYELMYLYSDAQRADHQFLGWAWDPNAEDPDLIVYEDGMTTLTNRYVHILMDGNKTLYAVWGVNHTLSFDGNAPGDTTLKNVPGPSVGTYVRGSSTKPSRTGYRFAGWSYTADGSRMTTDFSTAAFRRIDSDVTVYAVWEAIEYTLSFDLNGGFGPLPRPVVYTIADKPDVVLPTADGYSKEGRVFLGWAFGSRISDLSWNKDLSASNKKIFYAPGATIPASVLTTSNKTIYAVWKYVGVTEGLDLNGGTRGPGGYPKTVNYGTSWSLPLMTASYYKDTTLPDGTQTNNLIRGWYVVEDGTVHPHGNIAAGDAGKLTMMSDTTIMALYEYTLLSFKDGEETVGSAVSHAEYSLEVYLFPNSDAITPAVVIEGPEKTGHTFRGWAVEPNGEIVYQPGDTLKLLSDLTLYAIYDINRYTLRFNANGGVTSPESVTVVYGTKVTLGGAELPEHDFLGWAETPDASAAAYAEGDEYTVEDDAELFAVWKHVAGWFKNENDKWTYYDEDGSLHIGWLSLSSKTYYLDENGEMLTGWQEIDGERYWFYSGGSMRTGWAKLDGEWYYFDGEGRMQIGFVNVSGSSYCMDEEGRMLTGWQKLDGRWYYFNTNSGAMSKGWKQIGGKWYYFSAEGLMQTGWQQINGKWYYLHAGGAMHTGWLNLDGTWYYFDTGSGAMQTGWKQIGGKWYYFNAGGSMRTGWLKYKDDWYYFDTSGAMLYSTTVTISGKRYSFDSEGRLL